MKKCNYLLVITEILELQSPVRSNEEVAWTLIKYCVPDFSSSIWT